MDTRSVDELLEVLAHRLVEIRVQCCQEDVYEAFAGEVEAREGGLNSEQRIQLHVGAEAMLVNAGL